MKTLGLVSPVAIMMSAGVCHAQTAQPPATASAIASEAPSTVEVEEIIVTANKRAESLQKVPVAVTAVSTERLKSLNVVSVADMQSVAPSITFVAAPVPQNAQFVIRGVGTFASNDALEQSVGVVIDGIPLARLAGALSDTVDVARLQVLRGPQGTLFGKNATAGVISVDYQNALFENSGTARLFAGTYDEYRAQGTVNVMLNDNVAARLTGWYFRRDGFVDAPNQRDRDFGDFVNRGARLKVALLPTSDWRIDLTGEYSRNWADGSTQTIRSYLPVARDLIIQQVDLSQGVIAGPNNLRSAREFPENAYVEQKRATINSVLNLGAVDVTAIAGYIDTTSDNISDFDFTDSRTFAQGSVTHYRARLKQFTGELRLSNADPGDFGYTAGLFYYNFDEHVNQNATNLLTTAAPSALTSFDQLISIHTTTYAAFADVSYQLGPVKVFAGGRYSHETSSGSYQRMKSEEFVRPNILFGAVSLVNPDNVYEDFSWRLGAQYQITDAIMLYGTASRAYKGPGFNYTLNISPAQFAVNRGVIDAKSRNLTSLVSGRSFLTGSLR